MRVVSAVAVSLLLLASALTVHSQDQTGIPPFSTVGGGPDEINLGDLSIHYSIPVFSRTGRLPFSYSLSWDNEYFTPSNRWYQHFGGGLTAIGGIYAIFVPQQTCTNAYNQILPLKSGTSTPIRILTVQLTPSPFSLTLLLLLLGAVSRDLLGARRVSMGLESRSLSRSQAAYLTLQ
jgi:hypothetical protein